MSNPQQSPTELEATQIIVEWPNQPSGIQKASRGSEAWQKLQHETEVALNRAMGTIQGMAHRLAQTVRVRPQPRHRSRGAGGQNQHQRPVHGQVQVGHRRTSAGEGDCQRVGLRLLDPVLPFLDGPSQFFDLDRKAPRIRGSLSGGFQGGQLLLEIGYIIDVQTMLGQFRPRLDQLAGWDHISGFDIRLGIGGHNHSDHAVKLLIPDRPAAKSRGDKIAGLLGVLNLNPTSRLPSAQNAPLAAKMRTKADSSCAVIVYNQTTFPMDREVNQQNLPKADLINFIIIRVVDLAHDTGKTAIVPNDGPNRLVTLPAASASFLPRDGLFQSLFEICQVFVRVVLDRHFGKTVDGYGDHLFTPQSFQSFWIKGILVCL